MANYTTKLVDRTSGSPANLLHAIVRDVQSLFDEAFDGSNLQVAVSWGDARDIDNYVVHFVDDKTPANSYLLQTWPHLPNIDPRAGGHTYRDGVKSGSEVYRFDNGSRRQAHGIGYAKLILHELFHNQFPHVNSDEVHGDWGGGGLAAAVPVLFDRPHRINDRNMELIRRAFSVRTPQLI
jgi:hypothetical protein